MSAPYFSTVLMPIPGTASNSWVVNGQLMARALKVRSLKIRNAGKPRRRASINRQTRSAASRREFIPTSETSASANRLGPARVSGLDCRTRSGEKGALFLLFVLLGWGRRVLHDELDRRPFVHGMASVGKSGLTVRDLFAVLLEDRI